MGLGELSSGSMPGADILVGWVEDGTGVVHVEDRFAVAKSTPGLDDCQNWQLLDGEQQGSWTTIEAVRAVASGGDTQDRDFFAGMMKIIWAYGPADSFDYHGGNRGPAGVEFYGGSGLTPFEIFNDTMKGQPLGYSDTLLFPSQALIPPSGTTYFDAQFVVPPIASNADSQGRGVVHLVALVHYLNPASAHCVHHITLTGCYNTSGGDRCETLWAWAPGVPPLLLPPEAGFRVGQQPGSYHTLVQNVHYDNPTGACTGLVDNSGIVLYYSASLRANDAGTFTVGDVAISQPRNISQGSGTDFYKYDCPASCTNNLAQPFNVFGTFLHMHQVGMSSLVTQWRNGQKVRDLMRVEFWDFAFQFTVPAAAGTQILQGDELRTTCAYNRQPDRSVEFRDESQDEMCLHFIYGWPRPSFNTCGYYWNRQLGRNGTVCGLYGETDTSNPTVGVDPDTAISPPEFGTINQGYQCPSAGTGTSSTTSGTGTSSTASGTASGSATTTGSAVDAAPLAATSLLALSVPLVILVLS